MRFQTPPRGIVSVCACLLATASLAGAATIAVPAGGDLQAALNAAQPGDVITLQPGATYVGNFVLPNKGAANVYITLRSAASDTLLPRPGVRMTPAYASRLPKIKSLDGMPALTTAAGAHHWKLLFLEFQANVSGYGEILSLGAGDSSQTQLSQVPYALVVDRVYVHGDPVMGQKRCISLNSRDTVVINSYVSECKAINQDSQAIGGFNGPGKYLIENNYLEGAGENVLLGGGDPQIPGLVTTDVKFLRNHLRKPLSWRDPIVATPAAVSANAVPGGGSLAAGTYYYKVAARAAAGGTNIAVSKPAAEVSATIAAGSGGVSITWTPVAGAAEYLVYGRAAGAENVYWTTTNPYFTDSGASGTGGTPNSTGTRWSVKNIFELKNAQEVLVEGNVFENLWVADQPGYPIVFTPRNQSGAAPWVVVQRVIIPEQPHSPHRWRREHPWYRQQQSEPAHQQHHGVEQPLRRFDRRDLGIRLAPVHHRRRAGYRHDRAQHRHLDEFRRDLALRWLGHGAEGGDQRRHHRQHGGAQLLRHHGLELRER